MTDFLQDGRGLLKQPNKRCTFENELCACWMSRATTAADTFIKIKLWQKQRYKYIRIL